MDSNADFFVMKPIASLRVKERLSDVNFDTTFGTTDFWSNPMALRPFVSQLSVVTAYLAFALVGAIVLGVF
jgi:hypothetical protein